MFTRDDRDWMPVNSQDKDREKAKPVECVWVWVKTRGNATERGRQMNIPTDRIDWSQVWFCLSKGSQCYPDECHFGPSWVSFLPVCNEPQWGWTPCSPVPWPVSTNELLNKSVLVSPYPTHLLVLHPFSVHLSHRACLHSPSLKHSRAPYIPSQHFLSSNCGYLFVGQSGFPMFEDCDI